MPLENFGVTEFVYENSGVQGELYNKVFANSSGEELRPWDLPEQHPRAAQCAACSHLCSFLCSFTSTRVASSPSYTVFQSSIHLKPWSPGAPNLPDVLFFLLF